MKKNWLKYTIAFITVLAVRLIPFRTPNIEPIMAVLMPFGKVYGALSAFVFAILSIFVYDSVTSGIGIWTIVTALAYGAVGFASYFYFKNRKSNWKSYAGYAFIMTIIYDAITGLTIGPLFFHQSFMISLVGQIPFTLLHLLGNVSFAIVLSPVIERWAVQVSQKEVVSKKILIS